MQNEGANFFSCVRRGHLPALVVTISKKLYSTFMDFTEFNLKETLLKGIEAAGYTTCTDVQEQVLKFSQDGSDLYVQSQTGTGKTAAYLVAIIQEMLVRAEKGAAEEKTKALIMVPTRELAVQVEEEANTLLKFTNLKTVSVYGGVGYEKQIAAIKKDVDFIIGTPGRLIDLCEGKNLSLEKCSFVVVDEADRMFDMGFYPELRQILKLVPKSEERQTMLFSATLNTYVKNLAWEYTRDPKEIEIAAENITVSEIAQELLHVSSDDKMKLLIGILKNENPSSVIVFCNTKRACEVVAKRLKMNDLKADFIIGDLPQTRRLKILNDFKSSLLPILVATDVAARGIDVSDLAMVINFDLPNEAENYVHRIGRTARAGKSGKAYTFCSEQDVYNLPAIERFIEMQIPATVAYPEQMSEDKSAGVYIKTENWGGDFDDFHSPRRGSHHSERSRGDGRKTGRGHDDRRDGYKKRDGKRTGDSKDGQKRRNYKSNSGAKVGYKNDGKKSYERYENLETMEEMSFEERMKIYKDKYAKAYKSDYSKTESRQKRQKNRAGNKGSRTNSPRENKNYRKGGYDKRNFNDTSKSRSNTVQNRQKKQEQKKEQKGFFAKLKSLFGKK